MGLWWSLVVGWWGMETPMKSPMFAGQIPWNPHNPARPGTSRHFLPWRLTSPAAETQLGSMATGFSRSASSISASTETQHGAPGGEQGALEAFLKSRLGMMGMMGINQKMKCWIVLALHLSLQRIWKKERNLTLLVQKSESLTVPCWDFSGLHSKSWMQEHLFPLQTRHWVRHTFTTCLRFGCLTVSTQKAHDPAFASASCVHVCLHLHKHRIASCLEAYTLHDISARHQWAPVIWGPPFQFLYPGADSQVSHARSTSWRRTCQWCRWRSSSSPGPSGGNWLPKSNWEKGCPPWNWTLWLGKITNVAVPGEPAGSVCQRNLKKSDHGESAQKCKWSSYQEWMIIPRGQWDLTNYHGQLCSSWKWWALNGWSGCTPVSFRCQKQWFSLELQHQCGYGSKTFQNEVLYNGLGKVVWAIRYPSPFRNSCCQSFWAIPTPKKTWSFSVLA